MDLDPASEVLGVARVLAVSSTDWPGEYERLVARDREAALSGADLELLADAALWTGRGRERVAALERAYAAYGREGVTRRAGAAALDLYVECNAQQNQTAAEAWWATARRLLEDDAECAEHGMMLLHEGDRVFFGGGDLRRAIEINERVMRLADRLGDTELKTLARFGHGWFLVRAGEVERGLALIDQATVAAIGGEVSMRSTSGIYCGTITLCRDLGDYRRAGAWTDAANRWCERQAISGFPGECRVHRAEMRLMQGAWAEAVADARAACDELASYAPGLVGSALYEVGEVRRRLGDAAGAEDAYMRAHGLGTNPQPGLAQLRLAQGRAGAATAMLQSALDESIADALDRAPLLSVEVEVALAVGDTDRARRAAEELQATAQRFHTPMLEARACGANVELMVATDDPKAVEEARCCLRLWRELDAPYEAARMRVLLARALQAASRADEAEVELTVARADLERLGAGFDLAALDRLDERPATLAQRTLMFTDIVSSTALVEAIGDDAWQQLLRWHDRTLRSLFTDHGGEEIDHAGDGFFVAFQSPSDALTCAVAIQRTLAQHRVDAGFAPQVRVGVHSTTATVDSAGYRGAGVHLAARICAQADGGEVQASLTTAQAAPAFATGTPRSVELKGVTEPATLVSVHWQ